MTCFHSFRAGWLCAVAGALALGGSEQGLGQDAKSPVKVKVETIKDERIEVEGPLDPTQRLQLRAVGATFSMNIMETSGQRLHLGHFPTLKIDGMPTQPGAVGGRFEVTNGALPKRGTKPRTGYMNVWSKGDIRITQEVELTASKGTPEDRKRKMDCVIVRYTIENKGKNSSTIGLRTTIDSYLGTSRQCKFAAPTQPGKLLEGLELKDRDVPPYVQVLQQPDLKNPGKVAHVTFGLGSGVERPDRVVLTSNLGRRDLWDLTVQKGGFSTLIGFFWDPKEIRPGGKRELAYGYGLGVALPLGPSGDFNVDLGGSFDIGKTFTISALVADPAEGQALELSMPKGLERLEGKVIQPVALGMGDVGSSMVMWKGRVLEYGRFPIQIRSNTGITKTTILTVSAGS